MPTSPTMFERGNEVRLAGLFRHHLASTTVAAVAAAAAAQQQQQASSSSNGDSSSSVPRSPPSAHGASSVTSSTNAGGSQQQPRPDSQQQNGQAKEEGDYDPVDYRCFGNNATKTEPQSEVRGRERDTLIGLWNGDAGWQRTYYV